MLAQNNTGRRTMKLVSDHALGRRLDSGRLGLTITEQGAKLCARHARKETKQHG
jgi:hypothetical protein